MDNSNNKEQQIDYIDSLKLFCPRHKNTVIGTCGNTSCKNSHLLCMKCVKDPTNNCFNNEDISRNHSLETLSEVISSFFTKQDTNELDLLEFNNLLEAVKTIEIEDNKNKAIEYLTFAEDLYNKVIENIKQTLDQELNNLTLEYDSEIEELGNKYLPILREPHLNIDRVSISNVLKDKSFKKYLYDNINSTDLEVKSKCSKILKELSSFLNFTYVNDELSNIKNILYISRLKEIENLDKNFQTKLEKLESTMNMLLKEVETVLFPSKQETMVFLKEPQQKFETNPCNLIFKKNICENAHKSNSIDCVFTCFKSYNEEYVVVWGTPTYNIEAYDLTLEKVIIQKVAHFSTIFSTRHYQDKRNKIDMIVSSSYDKCVKVWNFNEKLKLIINISNAHNGYYIYSACLLIHEVENTTYVISSAPNEYMKLWNLQGKSLGDFGVTNQSTYFVSTYYDIKNKKYYIINANSADVKVYNFQGLTLYKTFKGTPSTWHMSAHVIEKQDKTILIESDGTGTVRSWDFNTGEVLSTVSSAGVNLRGLCIWNEKYVISSGSDHNVKIYDIESLKQTKNLSGHTSTVCSVMKIYTPKLGECLISHGLDGKLKLWVNSSGSS